jgi:hypothetical protein
MTEARPLEALGGTQITFVVCGGRASLVSTDISVSVSFFVETDK